MTPLEDPEERRVQTAVKLAELSSVVSALSFDIHDVKQMVAPINHTLGKLNEWVAAHEAGGPNRRDHEDLVKKVTLIEARQDNARLYSIPAVGAAIAAFIKAFFFGGQ